MPHATPVSPPPDERSDRALLALTRTGDRAAAGELYDRYARRIRNLAERRTAGSTLEPDDVVQSTFRTFLAGVGRGLYDVPDGQDLWALLVVVALNKVRAYARTAAAAKRTTGRRIDDASAAETLPDNGTTDPALLAVTQDVLNRFTPMERELVELRLAGHHVDGIAATLGRSKRTVERILQTCRERLLLSMDTHD